MERSGPDVSKDTAMEVRRKALKIAAGFFIASVGYIIVSSLFLSTVFRDPDQIAAWEIGKETIYITLSAWILYHFIKRGLIGVADAREDLHQIINTMPDAFLSLDAEQRFTFVNKRAAEIYRKPQKELIGGNLKDYTSVDNGVRLRAFLEKAIATQKVWHEQLPAPLTNVIYDLTAYPRGKDVSILLRNVTEERAVEDRMRRLSLALDNMADAFYVIDRTERFLFVNKSTAEFYHQSADDMVGESVWSYFAPGNVPVLRRMLHAARESGKAQRGQMGRDGGWFQVGVYPHGDECLVFFQDITQARESERALAQRMREQSALAKFSVTAFQSEDTPRVMEAAAELAQTTLDTDCMLIAEVDGAHDRVDVIAAAGLPSDARRTFKLSEFSASSIIPALVRDMRPVRLSDLGDSAVMSALPQGIDAKSGVGVAAYAADGTIVLFYTFATMLREFSDGECEFLQTMAHMIVALRDRREAANSLRLRDRALESITQGISIAKTVGNDIPTIYTNPAFTKMTGYSTAEIQNRGWEMLFAQALPTKVMEEVENAHRQKRALSIEVEIRRKDGSTFIDHMTSSPIYNAEGEITHHVAVHEDVTQMRLDEARVTRRNAMQAALAEFTVAAFGSENFSDLIKRAAGLARTALDVHYVTIMDVNLDDGNIYLLGADGWDFGDRRVYKFNDWPQDGLIPYSFRLGEPVRFSDIRTETRFASDFATDELKVRSGLVVMVTGWEKIRGFVSVLSRDVREFTDDDVSFLQTLANVVAMLKERQRNLERLHMRDRALHSISQGITVTDETQINPTIIYTNPAFAQMTGYTLNELLGMPTQRFLPPDPPPGLAEMLATARAKRREVRFDSKARRKDGTLFLDHVTAAPIVNAEGELTNYVSIHEDITQARQRDERLHESQKMEAVGQLTGGIAHDFNNLLTVVRANAEDMRDELVESPLLHRQADMILQAATRGADLVQQLMAFARKQELEPKVVDVNAMLESFTKLVRRTLQENVDMEVIRGENIPAIKVDPGRLENALLNLSLNARDAMPGGGKIVIETHMETLDRAYAAENPGVHPGRYVMIAVSDTGVGMTKEVAEKAFQPFFTTKEVGRGTGLGLSMVYGFVKQSGGHAKIYSEVGLGTTIKIYLPPTDATVAAELPAETAGHAAGSGNVLLVEDDDLVRQSVESKLLRMGYVVTPVTSAADALRTLEENPHFDLVFTDVIMPGAMTGADLTRDVLRRWPGIKVLMTSGYTEASALGKVKMPEGVRLLSKPYSNAALAEAFRDVLELTG